MDTVYGSTTESTNLDQVSALGILQPSDTVSGILSQSLNQSHVVDTVTTDQGVQHHQLYAIKVTFGVSLVSIVLSLYGSSQSLYSSIVSPSSSSSVQSLLNTGSSLELIVVLIRGLSSVHTTGRTDGVTTSQPGLLNDDNGLSAVLNSLQSSNHTSTAGTYHYDLAGQVSRGSLSGLFYRSSGLHGSLSGLGSSSSGVSSTTAADHGQSHGGNQQKTNYFLHFFLLNC